MVKYSMKNVALKSLAVAMACAMSLTTMPAASAKAADKISIENPVTAIHMGSTYDFDASVDQVTWTTSNSKVATIDADGVIKAKKPGEVIVVAKDKSGAKAYCKLSVVSKSGLTSNLLVFNRMLQSDEVTIMALRQLTKCRTYVIEEGDYTEKLFYINAPLSDVENYGSFRKINLVGIADHTYYEFGKNNTIQIKAAKAHVVVGEDATVRSIQVPKGQKDLMLEINGTVKTLIIAAGNSEIEVAGKEGKVTKTVVRDTAAGSTLTLSVPTTVETAGDINVVVLPGAEGSAIVAANADVEVKVDNKTAAEVVVTNKETGDSDTVDKDTTPSDSTSAGGSSSAGSSSTPTTQSATITGEPSTDGKTATYTLPAAITSLKSAVVKVNGVKNYTIGSTVLDYIDQLLDAESEYIEKWSNFSNFSVKKDNITISVVGTAGENTKTVTFDGVSYTVTVTGSSVTVHKVGGANTYTLTKSGKTTLVITSDNNTNVAGLVTFTVTY